MAGHVRRGSGQMMSSIWKRSLLKKFIEFSFHTCSLESSSKFMFRWGRSSFTNYIGPPMYEKLAKS